MIYCQHCGNLIDNDVAFCPWCGLQISPQFPQYITENQIRPPIVNPQLQYQQYTQAIPEYQPPQQPKKFKSKGLLVFKIILIVINVILATISITSLYTVASGNFNVILPEQKDISWELQSDKIVFKTNVTIQNGGLYSIEDLKIDVNLTEEMSNYSLIDYHNVVKNIPSQTVFLDKLEIPLKLDFDGWMKAGLDRLIFNDSALNLSVNVEAYYTMKLVRFYADYSLEWPWQAPIKAYSIDPSKIKPNFNNSKVTLELPYRLWTAGWLSGLSSSVNFHVDVRNDTKEIAKISEIIPLGVDYYHTLALEVSPSDIAYLLIKSQNLFLNIDVSTPDRGTIYRQTYTYEWKAPLESLTLGAFERDIIHNLFHIPLIFVNQLPIDLTFVVATKLLDQNGNDIGNAINVIQANSGTPIDQIINVSYSNNGIPSSIVITLTDPNTGLNYTINENLVSP